MSRNEKLLAKAWKNPGGLRFAEAQRLAELAGYTLDRSRGSHHVYVKDGVDRPLSLQEGKDGKAKAYQVRQILAELDQ